MELKDFIEQSVSDIIEAIKELKQRYNISPQMSGLESSPIRQFRNKSLKYNDLFLFLWRWNGLPRVFPREVIQSRVALEGGAR